MELHNDEQESKMAADKDLVDRVKALEEKQVEDARPKGENTIYDIGYGNID